MKLFESKPSGASRCSKYFAASKSVNRKRRYRVTQRAKARRRGATLVLAVALMFALFGFLAFSIDTGYLSQARAEMRRTADAAALAGCWELYGQMENGIAAEQAHESIRSVAAQMASMNPVCMQQPQLDTAANAQDVQIGYVSSIRSTAISNDSSFPFFAVQVNVSRTQARGGEIPFFFGRIFGDTGRPMESHATAVMARSIDGFSTPPNPSATLDILPFALDEDTWDDLMSGATSADNFAFDASTNSVGNGSDGVCEVNLYPQGTGSPGNRGTVDIGGSNNSTNDIARQIVHGISVEDLQELGKPLALSETGLTLNGDTGISAGVKDELASIIGEKRIIPVFSSVSGNGNNATYMIVKWVGVRILDVKLTGKMSGKKLIVQPAPVVAPYGTIATSGTQWSDFVLSPVLLAN